MRQRVALVATLARLYVGVVLIDRECECRGYRRRIVGVVYDHMCQQQCDQRIGYAAGLRPGNMSQIGARSAYLALRDFDPANVSCGSKATFRVWPRYFRFTLELGHRLMQLAEGLTFLPPAIRQKPREQTRTNVNDLDRETLILFEFSARVLRS